MARYRCEVTGSGAEIVYAKMTKKLFSYWKDKSPNDLSPEIGAADNHPSDMVFIENYDWSSRDDLGHFEGAFFSFDAEIAVYEEATGGKIWSSSLGEANLPDELQESIESDEFFIDGDEHKFIFEGTRILNGCFLSSKVEAKKFDLKKLGLSTMDVMGKKLLVGITYDGSEIEIGQNDLMQTEIRLSVISL